MTEMAGVMMKTLGVMMMTGTMIMSERLVILETYRTDGETVMTRPLDQDGGRMVVLREAW